MPRYRHSHRTWLRKRLSSLKYVTPEESILLISCLTRASVELRADIPRSDCSCLAFLAKRATRRRPGWGGLRATCHLDMPPTLSSGRRRLRCYATSTELLPIYCTPLKSSPRYRLPLPPLPFICHDCCAHTLQGLSPTREDVTPVAPAQL